MPTPTGTVLPRRYDIGATVVPPTTDARNCTRRTFRGPRHQARAFPRLHVTSTPALGPTARAEGGVIAQQVQMLGAKSPPTAKGGRETTIGRVRGNGRGNARGRRERPTIGHRRLSVADMEGSNRLRLVIRIARVTEAACASHNWSLVVCMSRLGIVS